MPYIDEIDTSTGTDKKSEQALYRLLRFGAGEGTWTLTSKVGHRHLKPACLPIPALPHINAIDIIAEEPAFVNHNFPEDGTSAVYYYVRKS